MPATNDALTANGSDSRSSYKGLALSAAFCAAASLYMLLVNAHDPKLVLSQSERTAELALNRIGYTWAKVRIQNGVAHISGKAPGEPERVLAYETVYKALRPAMTEAMTISRVASHLTLPQPAATAVAGSDLPPPEVNFTTTVTVATAEDTPVPAHIPSGTTWTAAEAPALATLPAEATVYMAQATTPAQAIAAKAAAPSQITTAAIDKPASAGLSGCKSEFASLLRRSGISFASTSAKITKESGGALDKLAVAAKRCENFSIAIDGHTDGFGSPDYNLSLSRNRAEAVRRALIQRGVKPAQVAARGYGATKPLSRNAAASARNRRIEFTVSEKTADAAKPKRN